MNKQQFKNIFLNFFLIESSDPPERKRRMQIIKTAQNSPKLSRLPEALEDRSQVLLGKVICIEGSIAVGKSDFVKRCGALLTALGINNCTFAEEIDMDLLNRFNNNPAKFATLFQKRMMTSRLTAALNARDKSTEGDSVVLLDTGIMREIAFTEANFERGNMTREDRDAHMEEFVSMFKTIDSPTPDVILLLDCPEDRALDNLNKRQRSNENLLSLNYLEAIRRHYIAAAEHELIKGHTKVLVLDVSKEYAQLSVLDSIVQALQS